jgi:hypothetical protein
MSGETPNPQSEVTQGDLFNQFDAEAAEAAQRVVEERKVTPPTNPYATQELMADLRSERDTEQLKVALDQPRQLQKPESPAVDEVLEAEPVKLSGPAAVRAELDKLPPSVDLYGISPPKPSSRRRSPAA